jgi:CO/xanthine dehydrogenase Mo-binding subunit
MENLLLLQDIPYRSTFFAVTIRSPVPKGRLLSIEHPSLERAYTLITAKDIPGKNELAGFPVPVLAAGELSYLGEPVAILTGPDRAKLESYAGQCRVIIQEERPVFATPASVEDPGPAPPEQIPAKAPGAVPPPPAPAEGEEAPPGEQIPLSGALQRAGAEPVASGSPCQMEQAPSPVPAEPEIFLERSLERGHIDAAFASPVKVLSATYTTGIQEHAYSEPVGALVEYISGLSGTDGEEPAQRIFVIHTATQWPGHVSRSAAQILGLEESQIITEAADPGIPMDGKIWYPSLIACQAALAAYLIQRNVRLLLTREEDFRFSPKRNASLIKIQSALGEKGEILGTKIDLTVDLGAQAVFDGEILDQSCLGVLGIAGRGALSLKARAIRTNIPPQGPFSGFGAAQGGFAMERHGSLIADSLGLDPAEWRKDNYPHRKDFISPESAPIDQLLDTAAAMADYYRKWGSYELLRRRRREEPPPPRPENLRGIGIALGRQGNGFLHIGESGFSVEVTLNIDGSLEIRTSVKAGKEFTRIWSNIARETLGVEEENVRVVSRNTALCPDSGPESLSRNIGSLTPLVERSCQTIRNQRFRDPLPITVREIPGETEEKILSWKNGSSMKIPNPGSLEHPGWAAAVVEAELEPHSYSPVIRGLWLAVDGGRILSEGRARRGLKLAAIQALGWASGEYLEYQGGGIWPAGITAYGIPNPGEIPPIRIDFLWNDAVIPKGIGELPFCCIPAAYIQAVSQAVDHPFGKIPLRPADIWEVFSSKAKEQDTEDLA